VHTTLTNNRGKFRVEIISCFWEIAVFVGDAFLRRNLYIWRYANKPGVCVVGQTAGLIGTKLGTWIHLYWPTECFSQVKVKVKVKGRTSYMYQNGGT